MLQPLEGRLKWEQRPDGILVDFRAANSKTAVRESVNALLLRALCLFPLLVLVAFLLNRMPGFRAEPVWRLPLWLTVCMVLGSLNHLFVRRTLRLTKDMLVIQFRNGPVRKTYSFETRLMQDLRFIPRLGSTNWWDELFVRESELQFDVDSESESCFVGINEAEASALIAKMMEVYPFPKQLPVEETSSA